MKKTLSALLIATLALASVTACGKGTDSKESKMQKPSTEKPTPTTTSKSPAAQAPTSESIAASDAAVADFDTIFTDPLPERAAYEDLTEPVAEEPWVDRQAIDRSNPDVIAALEAYKAVLNNLKDFSFTYEENPERYKQSMVLNELIDFFNNYHNARLSHFALIDLDRNNVPEVVLAFGEDAYMDDFVVLHSHEEKISAFYFYIRSFNCLKADGTFLGSSGAMENYRLKITFVGNTYMQESYTHGHSSDIYYVYGKQVTKEEYHKAIDKEESKPDATWHEYSEENIKKFFP